MLPFRTEIQPQPAPFILQMQKPLLSLGSCFADVIGQRLLDAKFKILVNPFGTLFHPLPLCRLLEMAIKEELPQSYTYLYFQERWLNYLLHSSLNTSSQEELQEQLRQVLNLVKSTLIESQALIITLGTSFVYELQTPFLTVANCHKQPQRLFKKRLAGIEENFNALLQLWQMLLGVNPNLKLILTVSPVRHLKDSLELNSVSKSMLRVLCHELVQKYPLQIYYFPSYELLLDDLRDYRFYKEDMLHPSAMAEQYVWEKFTECLLDTTAQEFLKKWEPLQLALKHKAFNPTSAAHRQFLENTLQKLQALTHLVDVSPEIQKLREQLNYEPQAQQPPKP